MDAPRKQQDIPFEPCPPKADAMFESMRAFGYDLGMAVADLIDNSIAAGAHNVRIIQKWLGQESYLAVLDDGEGMDDTKLKDAMRLGSLSPLEPREPSDLGRFGLGLKTASLSQCRKLSVMSKRKSASATLRCWDLDYLRTAEGWPLLKSAGKESLARMSPLETLTSGTIVLWERMDRVAGHSDPTDNAARDAYYHKLDGIRRFLEMVFHRYIGPSRKLSIGICSADDFPDSTVLLHPWDPFLGHHPATQELSREAKEIFGDRIAVRPYVLPHASKLTQAQHEAAAGPHGWNAQQGFYVYRRERLIVAGGWLDLGYKQEEHYKLARIQIDIPNNMDEEWKLDVKKSTATPPDVLKAFCKRIAKVTRERASDVYRHRGRVAQRRAASAPIFVWRKVDKDGRASYKVDRQHPIVKQLIKDSSASLKPVSMLLRLIESTVPVEQIVIANNEMPDAHVRDGNLSEETDLPVARWFRSLVALEMKNGATKKEAVETVIRTEPFDQYPELLSLEETVT